MTQLVTDLYHKGGIAEVFAGVRRFIRYRALNANRMIGNRRLSSTVSNTSRIQDEDWDNLYLLDGCRYDLFADHNPFTGDLTHRITKGSSTPEFVSENFSNADCSDIVYVTANPQYKTVDIGNPFHSTIDVWQSAWDEEVRTVRPEAVVEASLEAIKTYPNKRLLVHFIQPHYPFIGDMGRKLKSHSGIEMTYREAQGDNKTRDDPTVWDLVWDGELHVQDVWDAYAENLELVLNELEELLETIDGKTVVTSDHGNLVGERLFPIPQRAYGHPKNLYVKQLVKVPWLEIECGNRRSINKKRSSKSVNKKSGENPNMEEVKKRLKDLGYN